MSESQYPPHQTHSFPCEVCLGTGPCAACNGSRKILLLTCGLCKLPLDRPGPHNCPSCGGTMTALLDGWNCGNCKVFNGAAKEWLSECRSCGQPGPKTSGAAADSAKEEPFLTILNSEPRITELLLSSGDIYD